MRSARRRALTSNGSAPRRPAVNSSRPTTPWWRSLRAAASAPRKPCAATLFDASGCRPTDTAKPSPEPKEHGMTQIAIVTYPGFTALDFIGPYEVLRWLPDTEVRFVWHEPGPITADSGVLVIGATHSFAETPSPDVILVPGGMTTVAHARDETLLDWVRTAHRSATWTASVCSGSVILAAAGLLDGKRATSHWMALPVLKTLGAIAVSDERVVHQGDIVTSAGVSAGIGR